jgi:hypothetical protein
MDAAELLALLPERRGRKRKRTSPRQTEDAERSSTRQREDAEARLAANPADMDAEALLALIPKEGRGKYRRKPKWQKQNRIAANRFGPKMTGLAQQRHVQMMRHNSSGRALRADAKMTLVDNASRKLKGPSAWKKWTPEAIQRAAFTKVSGRAFQKLAREDKSDTALGKITSSAPDTCKRVVAHCITEGIEKRKRAIVHKSFADPLNFWINSHVADETKLWYIVPGYGYHKFSTLSYHSLCTWQEDDGAEVRDEDLIRAPEALAQYNAATQYNVLREDGCAGVTPEVGLRPVARFYGTALVWDSHKVNKLTTKYVRARLEPGDVLVPSYCLQHHTGNTATAVTS